MTKLNTVESLSHNYHSLRGSIWTVAIANNASENSYFECEAFESSGILEFDGTMLVEYDGVFELPKSVCRVLHQLGYTFDKHILPDGLVF